MKYEALDTTDMEWGEADEIVQENTKRMLRRRNHTQKKRCKIVLTVIAVIFLLVGYLSIIRHSKIEEPGNVSDISGDETITDNVQIINESPNDADSKHFDVVAPDDDDDEEDDNQDTQHDNDDYYNDDVKETNDVDEIDDEFHSEDEFAKRTSSGDINEEEENINNGDHDEEKNLIDDCVVDDEEVLDDDEETDDTIDDDDGEEMDDTAEDGQENDQEKDDDFEGSNTVPSETPKKSITLKDGKMFEVVGDVLYHDKSHFTQGLTYSPNSNILFESTGLWGKSKVCRMNPGSGKALNGEKEDCLDLDQEYFGEGLQVYGEPGNEKLIQITWKKQKGFIYDASSLETIREFSYKTTKNEGWGICFDKLNNQFIVSDGSSNLHFWDADTLKEKRRVEVTRQDGKNARDINELEFVNGMVLANVWHTDIVLVIDPLTGECVHELDFSSLWPQRERLFDKAGVLNGISVSDEDGILYFTGKNWNRMYKVKLDI